MIVACHSSGPVVVVGPLNGQLWVEERLSSGAVRVWSGQWRIDGEPLTEEQSVSGHRFDDGRLISAPGAHGASETYGYDDAGRLDKNLQRGLWQRGTRIQHDHGGCN